MKLIITTLIFLALALGPATTNRNAENDALIAHFTLDTPAEFMIGQNFSLDLDNDGVNDFNFNTSSTYEDDAMHTRFIVHALQDNEILSWKDYAMISEKAENISAEPADMEWRSGAGEIIEQITTTNDTQWDGLWSGDRAQYLAVKLHKGDNAYYGWIQVTVDPITESAKVVQYAINRVPSGNIAAGQTN